MSKSEREIFRPAKREDKAFFLRLSRSCFPPADEFYPWQVSRFLANPSGSIQADVILDISEDAGFAVWITRKGAAWIRLYALCAEEAHRGKGLCRTYLEVKLKGFVGKFRECLLEVRLDNTPAIRLYESLGFKVSKTFEGYYRDKAPALRMVRAIPR